MARQAGERQAGTHPKTDEADEIVLASCAAEFPNATLVNTIGGLYPLASQRAIFADRVVRNTRAAGFRIQPRQVPVGDTDTLGTVSTSVVANAVA